jgi:hypothetical protein
MFHRHHNKKSAQYRYLARRAKNHYKSSLKGFMARHSDRNEGVMQNADGSRHALAGGRVGEAIGNAGNKVLHDVGYGLGDIFGAEKFGVPSGKRHKITSSGRYHESGQRVRPSARPAPKSHIALRRTTGPNRPPVLRNRWSGIDSKMPTVPRSRTPALATSTAHSGGLLGKRKRGTTKGRSGVAVAYRSVQHKPYFKMHTENSNLVVFGQDRLGQVTIDSRTDDADGFNVSGSTLARYDVNPLFIGERLRRLGSCFENYNFRYVRVHFVTARPSDTAGSMLGFFDLDPNDEYEGGDLALTEANAHASANYTKVWDNDTWHMPKPPSGRYYVEHTGDSPSEKRLEKQAVFRLLLDVPFDEFTGTKIVGTLFLEYCCVLSRPTIQPNFVGTGTTFSATDTDGTGGKFSLPGGDGIFSSAVAATTSWTLVPNKQANARVTFNYDDQSGDFSGTSLRLGPGCWFVGLSFLATGGYSTSTGILLAPSAATNLADAEADNYSAANLTDGYANPSTTSRTIAAYNTLGFTNDFRCVIPDGEVRYITWFVSITGSGTGTNPTVTSLSVTVASFWPDGLQSVILSPSTVSITHRLAVLEKLVGEDPSALVEPIKSTQPHRASGDGESKEPRPSVDDPLSGPSGLRDVHLSRMLRDTMSDSDLDFDDGCGDSQHDEPPAPSAITPPPSPEVVVSSASATKIESPPPTRSPNYEPSVSSKTLSGIPAKLLTKHFARPTTTSSISSTTTSRHHAGKRP